MKKYDNNNPLIFYLHSPPTGAASGGREGLHAYNTTSIEYINSMDRYYVSVTTHVIGFICYVILTLVMTILLAKQWKEMIPFKRFFYSVLIVASLLQILSQGIAIAHDVGALSQLDEYLTQLFFIIYYCGLMLTVVMCNYCQGMVSTVLYRIYFHKSQSWMRKGAENYSSNERFRKFVKYYSIGMTVTWTVIVIILIPTTLILSMLYYIDGVDKQIGRYLGEWSINSVAIIGLVNSVCSIVTGLLNFIIVILLYKCLILNQQPISSGGDSSAISLPRLKACRKLFLLTFGQFYMALINTISIMLGTIGVVYPYIFILTGVIHPGVFLLFSVCVSVSFGPIDFLHFEARKLDCNSLKRTNTSITTITISQLPTSTAVNPDPFFHRSSSNVDKLMIDDDGSATIISSLEGSQSPTPKGTLTNGSNNHSFLVDSKALSKANEQPTTHPADNIASPFELKVV